MNAGGIPPGFNPDALFSYLQGQMGTGGSGMGQLMPELQQQNEFDQAATRLNQLEKAKQGIMTGKQLVQTARGIKKGADLASASKTSADLLGKLGQGTTTAALPTAATEVAKQGIQNGGLASFLKTGAGGFASAGLGIGGKLIQEIDKKDGNYSTAGAMGGGAMQGAAMGAALGPLGMIAGGAIGAGVGYMQKGKFEANARAEELTKKTDLARESAQKQLAGRAILKTFPVEGIKNQIYAKGGETDPKNPSTRGIINAQNFLRQQGVEMPADGKWSDEWEQAYTDYLDASDSSMFEPMDDQNATNTKEFGRVLPLNASMLVQDVFDNQLEKLTGYDRRKAPGAPAYTKAEKEAMDAIVQRNLEKGKYHIEYGDYNTGTTYGDVGGGSSTIDVAKKSYSDAYNLKTTFGQAMIGEIPAWNDRPADTMVYDTYDFNNAQDKPLTDFSGWKSVGGALLTGNLYGAARALGTEFGSKDGKGRTNTMITNRAHGGPTHPTVQTSPDYIAEGGEMIQHAPGDLPATDRNGSVKPITETIARIEGDKHIAKSGGVGMSGDKPARIYSDQLHVPADVLKQLMKL